MGVALQRRETEALAILQQVDKFGTATLVAMLNLGMDFNELERWNEPEALKTRGMDLKDNIAADGCLARVNLALSSGRGRPLVWLIWLLYRYAIGQESH